MEIKDNVALVTGGASGLGRAAVEHIVANGGKAAIVDINEEKANDVIAQLGDENVIFINTNVMEEDSVKNALSVVEDKFSKLNFVINCAGTGYGARILGKKGPHPLDIFKFIIDLNLVGTFNVLRLGSELIDANEPDDKGEKGVIINTASIGVSSKDLSETFIKKGNFVGITNCYEAAQKKQEFGGAKLMFENLLCDGGLIKDDQSIIN